MKIVSIIGARPQFIKAAIVSKALKEKASRINEIIVHTGQHYDENMSQIFFDEMQIPQLDYSLNIGSGSHGYQTGQMLAGIEGVLLKEKPRAVMVYGDTNSTLAGALAAAKLHIPVVHVEAGLRSFNRKMPEEINRVLTDHIADILFAPTETAVNNLLKEGISREKIHLVGDVMYDAALYYGKIAEQKSSIISELKLKPKQYILVTIHRAENTDDFKRLKVIIDGLIMINREFPVIFPIHPRTKAALEKYNLLDEVQKKLIATFPVGYLDMIMLEKNAKLIVTDSGGVQKEAYFCQVPCITLRDETEWVELVDCGWNKIFSPNNNSITLYEEILRELKMNTFRDYLSLYGDGQALLNICKILQSIFTQ